MYHVVEWILSDFYDVIYTSVIDLLLNRCKRLFFLLLYKHKLAQTRVCILCGPHEKHLSPEDKLDDEDPLQRIRFSYPKVCGKIRSGKMKGAWNANNPDIPNR